VCADGAKRLRGWMFSTSTYTEHKHEDCWPEAEREWWIYFMQGDDGGPIKIGRTQKNPKFRLSEVNIGYPFGVLGFCGLVRGKKATERGVHRRFNSYRLRGEWFKPSAELLTYILSLPEPT
jgi:hypothetical protein